MCCFFLPPQGWWSHLQLCIMCYTSSTSPSTSAMCVCSSPLSSPPSLLSSPTTSPKSSRWDEPQHLSVTHTCSLFVLLTFLTEVTLCVVGCGRRAAGCRHDRNRPWIHLSFCGRLLWQWRYNLVSEICVRFLKLIDMVRVYWNGFVAFKKASLGNIL